MFALACPSRTRHIMLNIIESGVRAPYARSRERSDISRNIAVERKYSAAWCNDEIAVSVWLRRVMEFGASTIYRAHMSVIDAAAISSRSRCRDRTPSKLITHLTANNNT